MWDVVSGLNVSATIIIIVVIMSCNTIEEGLVTGPILKGAARARALKQVKMWCGRRREAQ